MSVPSPQPPPPPPPSRLRTRDKLLLSANLVVATLDDSLARAFDAGAARTAAVVGHKYGPEAGRAAHLGAHTARNVALVYVDARGLARRALVRKAARGFVKARFASGGGREMSGMVVDRQEPEAGAKR